jgi:hypothetical protein
MLANLALAKVSNLRKDPETTPCQHLEPREWRKTMGTSWRQAQSMEHWAGDSKSALGMLLGMALGFVSGALLGAAADNMPAGLAIGIGVGGSLSAIIGTTLQKPSRPPTREEIFPFATMLCAGVAAVLALSMLFW